MVDEVYRETEDGLGRGRRSECMCTFHCSAEQKIIPDGVTSSRDFPNTAVVGEGWSGWAPEKGWGGAIRHQRFAGKGRKGKEGWRYSDCAGLSAGRVIFFTTVGLTTDIPVSCSYWMKNVTLDIWQEYIINIRLNCFLLRKISYHGNRACF